MTFLSNIDKIYHILDLKMKIGLRDFSHNPISHFQTLTLVFYSILNDFSTKPINEKAAIATGYYIKNI